MNTLRRYLIPLLFLIGSLSLVLGFLLLTTNVTHAQTNPSFHPAIRLLDADGVQVQTSGMPVSAMTTCGDCHDTAFIAANSSHADGALRSVRQDAAPFTLAEPSGVETNCFMCHLNQPDNAARLSVLDSNQSEWASSATLRSTGIITDDSGEWQWSEAAFQADGTVDPALLRIQDPSDANCGQCHGTVHSDGQTPLTLTEGEGGWETLLRGQVFSPQRISNSALNVADKEELTRVWDVHSQRLVGCTDCHYAQNNPVYDTTPASTGPEHLQFDPRRMDFGEYLHQPLHRLANSDGAQESGFSGSERSCDSCHESINTHSWLPYAERHFDAVACETCHVPTLYGPALESINWTALHTDGSPVSTYRGTDGTLLIGFQPIELTTVGNDGAARMAPYNLVSRWYWVSSDGTSVSEAALQAAWLTGSDYAPEVIAAFDSDRDGELSDAELMLDTPEKTALIANRLSDQGITEPRIAADVQSYAIHHNVIGGEWALGECTACHTDNSRVAAPISLGQGSMGGTDLTLVSNEHNLNGSLVSGADGQIYFQPNLAAAPANTPLVNLYILGHNSVDWINWAGALAFLGVAFGVSIHALLRMMALRRGAKHEPAALRPVYLYSMYERVWHWLQTLLIVGLLFTGMVIHNPETFSMFSFQGAVLVHNAMALVLVINAAFALVYHLVSGEIRQYLPKPYGFFDQAVSQAKYYLHGIFRGHPHPFAKSVERRLNPLQQITYLGILNVLLPLQVITGALMWAAQRLPDLTAQLGGLGFLAPFHTLIAWTFATFIVMHVYLTTTGHTPVMNIKAMMLGWDELEDSTTQSHQSESGPATPAQEGNS